MAKNKTAFRALADASHRIAELALASNMLAEQVMADSEPDSEPAEEDPYEGRVAFDDIFGKVAERHPFDVTAFRKVGDDSNLLVHRSKRDLWALTEDGTSVVRLYDPMNEPIILEKTASVEDRDVIRAFAVQARRKLVAQGKL